MRRAAFGGSPVPRLAGFDGELRTGIDTSPMTGVVLVLLIVFFVVTPAITGAKLPQAGTAEVIPDDGITVGIDEGGKYYVADKPVLDARLPHALRDAFAARPAETTLYLKAHDEVDYSSVLGAVEAARAAKVRRITAIVELPRGAAVPRAD